MWWPAIGGVAVGVVGYFAPRTLGVGYDNIEHILSGHLLAAQRRRAVRAEVRRPGRSRSAAARPAARSRRCSRSAAGSARCSVRCVHALAPGLGVDARIAALVGMAAIFAGASRALLASVVFAFETTRQPIGLLPLLGGLHRGVPRVRAC